MFDSQVKMDNNNADLRASTEVNPPQIRIDDFLKQHQTHSVCDDQATTRHDDLLCCNTSSVDQMIGDGLFSSSTNKELSGKEPPLFDYEM